MAARKKKAKKVQKVEPPRVRRSVLVDPGQMEKARKALGVKSDADVLRIAVDHLLSHFEHGEEE